MSCKTMSIDLANVPPVPIQIGVAGENSFRTITFDASKWGADYPDATYTVIYRRSDGYLYPVLVNASADAIVWNPTGTDTAVSGNGQLEVRLLDGETIGKTIIMQTYVAPSLSGDESEPSTPAPDWVNDVADDADRAEAAVEHYPQIRNGYWYVWDVESSAWVNTGVKASGEGGGSAANAVLYTAQTLTDAQKEQARTNVGAGTYSKPASGIPASDLASAVQTSLDKADTALQTSTLQTALDENVSPARFVLVRNGNTLTTVDTFIRIVSLFSLTPRRVMFIIVVSQSGGTVTSAIELYPTMIDANSRALTLAGYFDGNRYTAELTAASMSSTMTGALVVEPIVKESDIPAAVTEQTVSGWGFTKNTGTYSKPSGGIPASDLAAGVIPTVPQMATQADMSDWTSGKTVDAATLKRGFMAAALELDTLSVNKADKTEIPTKVSGLQNDSGYQTAQDVQTAIAAAAELPTVTASDNGKFLRVVSGAWAAQTVPSAESNSFGGGS